MSDQVLHDRVNLIRLVSKLEEDIVSQPWEDQGSWAWARVANVQESVKYARQLLKNVQSDDDLSFSVASTSSTVFPDIERILDRLEPQLSEISRKYAPPSKPRRSLLSSLPKPTVRPLPRPVPEAVRTSTSSTANAAADLLLSPSEEPVYAVAPSQSLPPPEYTPPLTEKPSIKSDEPQSTSNAFLSTSLKTQEELSAQLAQMATQLKLNAVHFTEALAKDRAVMEGAEEKLEGNVTRIKKEHSRLRVHTGKSGSTTWLVMGALLVVLIAWILSFLIIRIT